ncbi:RluA family pseudouridine synthase [Pokkaliibacter sp. CJK22405]|uniref:RluA family pseudouridine synthase n=1 Tax=Pokkaliibacter sp. CJK22405 TaxID=3384615 RepID=UPI0039856AD3
MTSPSFEITVATAGPTAIEWIASVSELPKARIKDAMNKGAVWLTRKGQSDKRLRRVRFVPCEGDILRFYYDPDLLNRTAPEPVLLKEFKQYSLWYKPPGLLSQGTAFADHCSLLRQVEVSTGREVYLIHRLDREAHGLVLLAHQGRLAAQLSQLFQQRDVDKRYFVRVAGTLQSSDWTLIDQPLDGKASRSQIRTLCHENGNTVLEVKIDTGRKHQIRRHLSAFGHPVLGDPRYGKGHSYEAGMQLVAAELTWQCPIAKMERHAKLAELHPQALYDWPV